MTAGVELNRQSSTSSMVGLMTDDEGKHSGVGGNNSYGTQRDKDAEMAAPQSNNADVTYATAVSKDDNQDDDVDVFAERTLKDRCWETFTNYFPLCYITFGGPAAHLGIMHEKFVVRKKWLDDAMFAELLAISSGLPGPASTQMAFTLAIIRDGVLPGIIAFLCWSVQGGVVMGILGGVVANNGGDDLPRGVKFFENGLASVAVALIAVAAYSLGNKLLKDLTTKLIATIAFVLTICFPSIPWMIPFCMVLGGATSTTEEHYNNWKKKAAVAKRAALSSSSQHHESNDVTTITDSAVAAEAGHGNVLVSKQTMYFTYSVRTGIYVLLVWLVLFIAAIVVKNNTSNRYADIWATFYFAGSIIFGGGPVVIPLLYSYVVDPEWMTDSEFLLGLAIINTMPGPNFNFAAYCGAASVAKAGGGPAALGGFLGWVGIFLPGLLIKAGILPIWRKYRGIPAMTVAFRGANAAAVGLVFTATYLLIEKALSISSDGKTDGPLSLLSSELYTSLGATAFVLVGLLRIQAPYMVVAGGAVGILDWATESAK